jgi:hypothetical protein
MSKGPAFIGASILLKLTGIGMYDYVYGKAGRLYCILRFSAIDYSVMYLYSILRVVN